GPASGALLPSPDRQHTARVGGSARTTAELSTAQAAPAPSTLVIPATCATGPASASPAAPKPNTPNVTNNNTLAKTSANTCCCITIRQNVKNTAPPAPATNAPPATAEPNARSASSRHKTK